MTFWDDNATREGVFNVGDMYDEYTRRQADFIVEQLDVTDGSLLDLGCGIGRLSGPVADRLPGVYVDGYDTSRPMLDKAGDAAGSRFTWLFGDLLLTAPRPYDGAWCVLTFQHLPDDTVKQHLTDLFEILKPGARLVTQWVVASHGQQTSPMSYLRHWDTVHDMVKAEGFVGVTSTGDAHVTGYADNWLWVTAEKP